MNEKPILFNREMILALHSGRKTQTRRIVKVRNETPPEWATFGSEGHSLTSTGDARPTGSFYWSEEQTPGEPLKALRRWPILPAKHPMAGDWYWTPSPYGKIGDRLWVREAWRVGKPHDQTRPRDILPRVLDRNQGVTVCYEAGGWRSVGPEGRDEPIYPNDKPMPDWAGKLRPSMFMPRAFSRTTLEVTSVCVERLQDISEEDAEAEGVARLSQASDYWRNYQTHTFGPNCDDYTCLSARESYRTLWDSINEERGFGWDTNPWVWVVDFQSAA
jgi:hypothetical protein